jgi:hypothetical protein
MFAVRGRPRILVIEHDDWLRTVAVGQLAGAGYQVCDASNGFSGPGPAGGVVPDVIVLGATLPDVPASGVRAELCSNPRTRCVFVIDRRHNAASVSSSNRCQSPPGLSPCGGAIETRTHREIPLALLWGDRTSGTATAGDAPSTRGDGDCVCAGGPSLPARSRGGRAGHQSSRPLCATPTPEAAASTPAFHARAHQLEPGAGEVHKRPPNSEPIGRGRVDESYFSRDLRHAETQGHTELEERPGRHGWATLAFTIGCSALPRITCPKRLPVTWRRDADAVG